jgi:predicted nuclease of predicted toxin-antitoxin system
MTGPERRFLFLYTDEDVIDRLAVLLREQGYGAACVTEVGTAGLTDEEQLAFAAGRGWTILTYNLRDFVELARRWHDVGQAHAGIVVSRQFRRQETGELLRQTRNLIETVSGEEMWNTVRHLQSYRQPAL